MAEEFHVFILPWSAFGHMIPFFEFSLALAKCGVRVSFVSTPNNIERLPKVPSSLASLITLVGLPLPKLQNGDDLPDGAEATMDIPFEKVPQLKLAYDLLEHPLKKLVVDESPNWIIIDFMPHWVFNFAQQLQIPVMYLSIFPSTTNLFVGPPEYLTGKGRERVRPSMESLMSPPPWINFTSSLALKRHEVNDFFHGFFFSNGTQISDAERHAKILKSCQAISIRTCREFEGPYFDLFKELLGKPVIPTGSLPREKHERIELNSQSCKNIFNWLDEQKPKSVVFVGFGSECKLSKEHIHKIAYGLEISELPFLWALRKPEWAKDESEVLPAGFEERTKGKGLVTWGWIPQVEILSHESIVGSFFHSGWGSIIDNLEFGLSLVVLPLVIDQGLNARILVEKGLAVEVETAEDGSFNGDDIAKALKMAMVSEEGEPLRVRAREAAIIFGDMKLQQHYIGQLVEFLKSYKLK